MPASDKGKTPIGLAIVGCGRVGRIRGRCALEYPGTEWIGCCDIDEKKGKKLAEDLNADFFTTDYRELLRRSEVNSAVLATDENVHAETLFESIEHGHRIIAEKPLATNVVESAKIVKAAKDQNIDLALTMLEQAYESNPNSYYILDSLAWAHYKKNNFELAAELMEKVIDMAPGEAISLDHLGDIYFSLNRKREAVFFGIRQKIWLNQKIIL